MSTEKPDEAWPCDWAGHELQQLRREASQSFRSHLEWLESISELAVRLQSNEKVKESHPAYGGDKPPR